MFKKRENAGFDKWGRIRLPADFLKTCKEESGDEVFVISTDDRTFQIYPLAAWHARVGKLFKVKKDDPLLRQFLVKANYNGQVAKVDGFGRIRIPALLRRKIKQKGEIAIEEKENHLDLVPGLI
jgi:DNA-binding transcriptional regulator/RsmH inhibitor MraZ